MTFDGSVTHPSQMSFAESVVILVLKRRLGERAAGGGGARVNTFDCSLLPVGQNWF